MPESTGVKPPAPPEPEIPDVETPRSSTVRSQHQVRRIGGFRKVAITGLGAISALTGANMLNNSTHSPSTESTPPDNTVLLVQDSVPQPTPETERAAYERQIEEKYGIELLSQKEGYERIGKTYDEADEERVGDAPPVRWRPDQLKTIDEFLSYLPESAIEPRNGLKFAISLWDYAFTEEYGGMSHGGFEMISVNQDAYKGGRNKENDFSLLAHELLGHRNDSKELKEKIDTILLDKSFLQNKLFIGENKYSTNNPDIPDAVRTLGSFAPGESSGEGRAGFAQLYVKGYERFMKAVGPVLDGSEFDPNVPKEELSAKYPRAHQIYDLYYNLIFEGKQYDEIARQLNPDFRYKDPSALEATPSPVQPDSATFESLSVIEQGLSNIEIRVLEQLIKTENFVEIFPASREESFEKQVIAPWGGQWLGSMNDILGWTQDGQYSNNWRMLHNITYDTRNIQMLQGDNTPLLSWGINQVTIVKQYLKDQPSGYFSIPADSRVFVRTLGNTPTMYRLEVNEGNINSLEVSIDAQAISAAKNGNITSVDGTKLPKTKPVFMGGHQPVGPLEAYPEIIVVPNSPGLIVEESHSKERQELSDKFNVKVKDLTIGQLTESQYEKIRRLLNLFPENFYYATHPVEGWFTNLVVFDGKREVDSDSVEILLTNGQLAYDPNESEHSVSAAKEIARVLVERFDEHRDYEAQKRVIKFLGGKKFIKNPAELYPYFKGKGGGSEPAYVRYQLTGDDTTKPLDKGKLVEYLTGYYIEGWDKFYRAFAPFFDPKIDYFEDWGKKNTKTYELYQLIGKEYFSGIEYETGDNGIQVITGDSSTSLRNSSYVPK